jgi:endonuclease YncB( thermonuclease family)
MKRVELVRVIDGDTIVVDFDDGKRDVHLRLYGIDAPESTQPYGAESAAALQAMLDEINGKCYMQVHGTTFNRLLATLYVVDRSEGPDLDPLTNNLCYRMVREGWAWYYAHSKSRKTDGSPKRRRRRREFGVTNPPLTDYPNAELFARIEGKGLWEQRYGGPAIEPHAYRHMNKEARRELQAQWRLDPRYKPIPRYRKSKKN